jgi:hypothetical protein
LDLQQQRIERAVGEELKATPTVITKTGLFDNIDKLYGSTTGGTATASTTTGGEESFGGGGGFETAPPPAGGGEEVAPPPAEGGAPEGGETAVTPESRMKNMNLLIESNLLEGSTFLDLGQGQQSLGEISKELDKLLNS